ncbi:MAG: hypothetical protein ABIU09_11145 [Pyrinomonadaceae bacterium]
MNFKKNFLPAFALGFSLLAFSAIAFGQAAPPDNRPQFSLYGLNFVSPGQTVGIWVQNPRFSDSEIIPCIRVRMVFDIYEASPTLTPGNPSRLRFVRRVSREIELDGGEAATFDYEAGRTGDYVSPAVFYNPVLVVPPDSMPARLLSTLVVRQGGRTILNLPAVEKGFDPQPDPPSSRPAL